MDTLLERTIDELRNHLEITTKALQRLAVVCPSTYAEIAIDALNKLQEDDWSDNDSN